MPSESYNLFAFIVGILGFVRFNVVGTLSLSEVVLIVAAPLFVVPIVKVMRILEVRRIVIFGSLYLVGLIASDIYRQTLPGDYLRGWAKTGITILSILIGSVLVRRSSSSIVWFFIGAMVSAILRVLVYGATYGAEQAYKYDIGGSFSGFAFLLDSLGPNALRSISALLPFAAGAVAFMKDSRSLAGVTILTQMWMMKLRAGRSRIGGRMQIGHGRVFRRLGTATLLAAFCYSIFVGYKVAVSHGLLGVAALEKYELQKEINASGSFNLFSGRDEVFFSVPKIIKSPIIGYGSWAKDWNYVYERASEMNLNAESMTESWSIADPGLIPTHSHLFGGWLEAGIFGGVFWSVVLLLIARLLMQDSLFLDKRFGSFFLYLLILFAWDILFSPYGAERRVWDGFLIAWICWALEYCRHNINLPPDTRVPIAGLSKSYIRRNDAVLKPVEDIAQ